MKELTSYEGALCANCQAPLQGEFCHHCGQSVHSVLRPVHGLFEEFFETFLHIDGRILHTLPALFLKPGFLTLEYFSGRRVRYIAPFRLMFVLCLLSFFVLHLATDVIAQRIEHRDQRNSVVIDQGADFSQAQTAQEVRHQLDAKLETLEATRAIGNAAIVAQIDQTEQKLHQQANARLAELGAPARASSASKRSGDEPSDEGSDGTSKLEQPIHISWLPAFASQRLAEFDEHIRKNAKALHRGTITERREAWEHLEAGIYGALPGTMLVLVPMFALLLKLFYIFKRRLYMEHLIVSLHSHAFLFVSLLLIVIAGMLSTWLRPIAAWTGYAAGLMQGALMLWVPAYLLIMQKRVYRQGWAMTLVKYWCVGWCYFWLLLLILMVAVVLGLAH
ncbi:DUF3667 domain-containing protein [Dyella nitratireducens]|uniref:DUF3667 domain-containing protein n=1 Tax=Dyella nitratireducens TaxID=1849580 RepID=A0ABQ1FR83_9GAMM|nr:DUF3667 domain-containing protein [Dyella nitratireducens]GGA25740.1 hypothetical protein GCM10010981_12930 [Dyella nitratireducens]GLQ43643.1 hypothetical protein GCM10007902_34930 [Dyella nitratireducens]